MYRREGNYMSLDPETAMRGVRSDMTDRELLEVAFNRALRRCAAHCAGAASRSAYDGVRLPRKTRIP